MRSLVLVLAVLVTAHAAPQGVRFSQKAYAALQQALGQRVPVAIYSGNQVFSMVEESPSDFVVLNLPGLTGASDDGFAARTGAVAAQVVPTDDDVAETFREVTEDAVEDVVDAAEEATGDSVESLLSADVQDNLLEAQPTAAAEAPVGTTKVDEVIPAEAPVEAAEAPVEAAEAPIEPVEAPVEVAEAPVEVAETLVAIRDAPSEGLAEALAAAASAPVDADTAALAAETVAAAADVVELARRKRQDDDLSQADELSFALAGLGSLIGSNVGRYLDATFSANVDLIEGFENTGLLVLDQVEERFSNSNENNSDGGKLLF